MNFKNNTHFPQLLLKYFMYKYIMVKKRSMSLQPIILEGFVTYLFIYNNKLDCTLKSKIKLN